MRSCWKPNVFKKVLSRKSFLDRLQCNDAMRIYPKGMRMPKIFSDKTVWVYNGKRFIELFIRSEILGNFLGSFVSTKLGTAEIHKKTKKNKRGRVNKKKKKKN